MVCGYRQINPFCRQRDRREDTAEANCVEHREASDHRLHGCRQLAFITRAPVYRQLAGQGLRRGRRLVRALRLDIPRWRHRVMLINMLHFDFGDPDWIIPTIVRLFGRTAFIDSTQNYSLVQEVLEIRKGFHDSDRSTG